MSRYPMISIPEAQATVLQHAQRLGSEVVPLHEAEGRVLAESVYAREPLPPFPASIKDGYAVLASDGVGEFEVVGESRAGAMDDVPLIPGTVAYITTGAPVPSGADAVVQVEDTRRLPPLHAGGRPRVHIAKAAKPGQDIRPVGSDIKAGAEVLRAGEVVGVAEVGILATVGAVELKVVERPHVAVMSTGDEVVDPALPELAPGQIRDCNRSMLLAAARQAGCRVTDLGIARDVEGVLEGCLERAIRERVDVLVTSGGVSMGDRDLVKPLLERSGCVHFGRVLMKPGKPLTFATLDLDDGEALGRTRRMLIFGLPGNPVSSFVCWHLAVVPAIRAMAGWAQPMPRRVAVRLAADVRLDPERPEYHRTTLQYSRCPVASLPEASDPSAPLDWWALSTGNQISSRLLSARSANCIVELPRASGTVKAGTRVTALLIDNLMGMPAPDPVPDTIAHPPALQQ